jgi:hypothetical protein
MNYELLLEDAESLLQKLDVFIAKVEQIQRDRKILPFNSAMVECLQQAVRELNS